MRRSPENVVENEMQSKFYQEKFVDLSNKNRYSVREMSDPAIKQVHS